MNQRMNQRRLSEAGVNDEQPEPKLETWDAPKELMNALGEYWELDGTSRNASSYWVANLDKETLEGTQTKIFNNHDKCVLSAMQMVYSSDDSQGMGVQPQELPTPHASKATP